jgi:ribosomal protein S18 acetylase RimI-like enzyme
VAEAFADEIKDCLLDDKLQIKKEYADIVENLPEKNREELNVLIKEASASRKVRVERQLKVFLLHPEETKAKVLEQAFFVAFAKNENGNILGVAEFRSNPEQSDGDISLELLAVDPQAQGRGLSRSLVSSILKLMPETNYIGLSTTIWNKRAHSVYKKLGFAEIEPKYVGCLDFEFEVKK